MNDWRAIKKEAEQAKGLLVADRSAGEQQFEALIRRHPGDASVWRRCFVGHMPPACSLLAPAPHPPSLYSSALQIHSDLSRGR